MQEGIGFLIAWNFYWDGPLVSPTDQTRAVYDREEWLTSDARQAWLDDLRDEHARSLRIRSRPKKCP